MSRNTIVGEDSSSRSYIRGNFQAFHESGGHQRHTASAVDEQVDCVIVTHAMGQYVITTC